MFGQLDADHDHTHVLVHNAGALGRLTQMSNILLDGWAEVGSHDPAALSPRWWRQGGRLPTKSCNGAVVHFE